MKSAIDYRLYLVTDSDLCSSKDLPEVVRQAIAGGVTLVQIREKCASSLDFYNTALAVKRVTDVHGIPLIINDRLDIALAVNAAGLHIGQSDLPAPVARRILGPGKILGVSVGCVQEALQAKADGADYLGVGGCFTTNTKLDADYITPEEMKKIDAMVQLPKVGIGGIKPGNICQLSGLGFDGVAVVSAIMGQADPCARAQELLVKLEEAGI